ncbi:nucleotidyltransferase [Bacillus sp. UMB0899]|uniref:nucleotidyltransferase n=1 Tax=Metabacillus schmidteae TaxID=2730405 RepID=UPI000C7FD156|nr:nucleotidyltransferase [Metabacillus schmidteae]PMC38329.1 nucleotidyltransferase [Bacillus sp. UMB0899]
MNVLGIVVEYNPLHNGHLFHLNESKKITNADVVIAVMSGYFLQRGEPALVSKWTRTEMALASGVDIVVELPYAFATQKAETFANGAVSILDALYCDFLCFGSEAGKIEPFLLTNELLSQSNEYYDALIQKYMKTGVSYPKAQTLAFQNLCSGEHQSSYIDLSLPNNILGYHYVKAIHDQRSKMKPTTIKRTSAGYHDLHFHSPTIASATSIRKAIFSGNLQIDAYVPDQTFKLINNYEEKYKSLHQWECYFQLLKYRIMTMSLDDINAIYEVEEGLEYRLKQHIQKATSFQNFMERIKTKRYTWTRLQRLCTHILTNTTKSQINKLTMQKSSYIRLLGMSDIGQKYLSEHKKKVNLPIISKLSTSQDSLLDLDIKAAHTYFMIMPEPIRTKLLQKEFATPPIRFNKN